MPKITPLQLLSWALGGAALIVATMAEQQDIKTEVNEAVAEALNGRDAQLLKPAAKPKA
jgi:hypothetical protein